MGLKVEILDRLEMVLGKCQAAMGRLVESGDDESAVELQAEVIDKLETAVLRIEAEGPDVDLVEAKKRIRFKKGKPGIKNKRYSCCTKPKRTRDRHGLQIWVSSCAWRAGTKRGNKPVIVGRAAGGKLPRPPKMLYRTKLGGISAVKGPGAKKVRWC